MDISRRRALIYIHGLVTVKNVGHDALIAVHDDPSDFFQSRLILQPEFHGSYLIQGHRLLDARTRVCEKERERDRDIETMVFINC